MYVLASQIFCNIATDIGTPGMCLCYQQLKHPAETAVGWREMSFCDGKLVFCMGLKIASSVCGERTKQAQDGTRGRNKGTTNKGLVKCRGDGPKKCMPQKKAPCHMREQPVDYECAYCASSPAVLEINEAHSPPKIQPSESTPSNTKRQAIERHTYDEGYINAEKQSKYRSTKKAKNRGSFPSFNFGCL